jgi:hypothetical protein
MRVGESAMRKCGLGVCEELAGVNKLASSEL